jgi:hypothetical protein
MRRGVGSGHTRSQPIAAQPAPFDQFKEFNSQLLDTFDLATVLARI